MADVRRWGAPVTPSGPLTALLDRYPAVRVQLVGVRDVPALYRVSVTRGLDERAAFRHVGLRPQAANALARALRELEEKTR